jgi:hypothetical protein
MYKKWQQKYTYLRASTMSENYIYEIKLGIEETDHTDEDIVQSLHGRGLLSGVGFGMGSGLSLVHVQLNTGI